MGYVGDPARDLASTAGASPVSGAFFIFIFFITIFYKNIFLILKFTEVYPGRPAAGRPGPGRPAAGRPASQAARLGGGRNFFLQFSPFREIIEHIYFFVNFCRNRP